ncbi:hypothetical protein TNCV_3808911 [Trichonephila clavipes]|nr:hypothetical protein TNCV_3808911 [Trichonephila clavipes]
MGDFKYADRHHMYGHANGNGRAKCIMRSFLIDECPITEFFSNYIVNFVKHVCSTSPDMMLVDEELNSIQGWKKHFERCG